MRLADRLFGATPFVRSWHEADCARPRGKCVHQLQHLPVRFERDAIAKRDKQRAIAGLSMGAGQALQIGLNHLDTFSTIGAFSGAGKADPKTAYGGAFADPAARLAF